jgi:polysaccharide export outer membrane protein
LLAGLAAPLGLWLAGCQAGPSQGTPAASLTEGWDRPPAAAVQLDRPRAIHESAGELQTVAHFTPAPVTRAAMPAESAPAGAVVASSWRPLPHAEGGPTLPGAAGAGPALPRPVGSGAVPAQPGELRVDAAGTTQLPAPQPVAGTPIAEEHVPVLALGHYPHAVPREGSLTLLPQYIVNPPDVLLIESSRLPPKDQPIRGQHLVRPDGTISLGVYGEVMAAGRTLDQIREEVAVVLNRSIQQRDAPKFKAEDINVDVLAYNTKVYYIITDGAGYGATVQRFPVTGSETVLDALSAIGGVPPVGSKKRIWIARATPDAAHPKILPVDWCSLVKLGSAETNYQMMPGDRLYVGPNPLILIDSKISQFLAPIDRALGSVLLGSAVVNSIKQGGRGTGTGTGTGTGPIVP